MFKVCAIRFQLKKISAQTCQIEYGHTEIHTEIFVSIKIHFDKEYNYFS